MTGSFHWIRPLSLLALIPGALPGWMLCRSPDVRRLVRSEKVLPAATDELGDGLNESGYWLTTALAALMLLFFPKGLDCRNRSSRMIMQNHLHHSSSAPGGRRATQFWRFRTIVFPARLLNVAAKPALPPFRPMHLQPLYPSPHLQPRSHL